MTSQEIRQSFLDFFESKGHKIVPSAPMVIKDDPTLMFTNAGMNQFKNIILGNDPIVYSRVADSQKCLRVSGKHNDLEEVGHDTYHHTMFEMLGNWSFGDYFKKEAIAWAWEYLVDVLKIDKERLYVTVFEGSPAEGLSRDDEAAEIWSQFLPSSRIINGNKKDNFWEMGDTGPCGPCSEIHIDLRDDDERAKVDALSLINNDHPQVIEIWNNVFMQFNRKADGSLEDLPAKVIDTGMGFERLCMALQGKKSNYDTDVFQPVIQEIARLTGYKYGENAKVDIAMRVIADHIRTIAFSITDGQLPSNAKAGYVIRRILRRAVRYGYTFLEQRSAFMYKLIPTLISVMGGAYPELISQQQLIEKVTKEEEDSFLRTLETGIRLLDKVMDDARKDGKTEISGKEAFTLYDTFGFPLDLTELILRENNFTVNVDEFNSEMQKQKERARNAAAIETGDWVVVREGESRFVGYDVTEAETEILRYRKVKQKNKEFYQIVLSVTPFYAEMGGQVGDSGTLTSENGRIEIIDTKKENNLSVHITEKLPEDVTETFTAVINLENRMATSCNHSATHLLHEALREILGEHVEQKGSYVSPDSLRFDFSHFQKMTKEEIREAEHLVNRRIRENFPLHDMRELPIAEAQGMGAMALFGEKYGEKVRVVRFGSSVELCGGTHVNSTGQIGMLRIVSENSIAAGVRRIEAITASKLEEMFDMQQDMMASVRELFNNTPSLVTAVQKTIEENADLKKQLEDFMREKIVSLRDKVLSNVEEINGIKVIHLNLEAAPDMIKTLAFQIRNVVSENLFFVAGSVNDGKPSLTVLLSDDLVAKGLNAVNIAREAAKEIQGGGGGQPFFAAAGGKNPSGIEKAIAKALEAIK
ncbi:alanine--tRNA ligase [Paludibacter sp. 221]|uniref:alanine--tRNA ligase n=1 Tax=Paludibacter sp. 221 TaxID=2302939 RepID=UPI0013D76EAD|nr:alanine--tRNA ligase [Paludibacter sp. 221]NDV47756.1 alanine--tRNA ligase [Paludibacter sp. 221]